MKGCLILVKLENKFKKGFKLKMNFYRIILGQQHSFVNECFENNFVGVDYSMNINLENDLPDNWREFNKGSTYLEKILKKLMSPQDLRGLFIQCLKQLTLEITCFVQMERRHL